MRHNKSGNRLSRTTPHRQAMIRNMVTSLLQHERIVTTTAKAKEVRKVADKMITLGKRGDLHARRQALAVVRDKKVVAKLFDSLSQEYKERPGGYTRIIRTGTRLGDAASMAILELVNYQEKEDQVADVAAAE
ncbi:50S ribosomal protein L17 [Desulfurivibrio dismutans]|uniref:50S ribosomal protein L17 n=1 Tax=Desulfurivibrio dismutans TaxID=1398908 RepID=UPI0023DA7222|nr:50S ribosomal protein L17 [Desulfurivibrio alkaliphilus]MDF1613485.1 50S ribosomal protein L17 [Desulfurivibrio alkaliphilus]